MIIFIINLCENKKRGDEAPLVMDFYNPIAPIISRHINIAPNRAHNLLFIFSPPILGGVTPLL